jgi:hypothetical protein
MTQSAGPIDRPDSAIAAVIVERLELRHACRRKPRRHRAATIKAMVDLTMCRSINSAEAYISWSLYPLDCTSYHSTFVCQCTVASYVHPTPPLTLPRTSEI